MQRLHLNSKLSIKQWQPALLPVAKLVSFNRSVINLDKILIHTYKNIDLIFNRYDPRHPSNPDKDERGCRVSGCQLYDVTAGCSQSLCVEIWRTLSDWHMA